MLLLMQQRDAAGSSNDLARATTGLFAALGAAWAKQMGLEKGEAVPWRQEAVSCAASD